MDGRVSCRVETNLCFHTISIFNYEEAYMKDLIKFIAEALVDNPDEVEVREISGSQTSVIELKVAKEDLGKIIGKQGRTAESIRTILSAASTKLKKRTVLEIIE